MSVDKKTAPKPSSKKIELVAKDGTIVRLTPSQKRYADLKMELPGVSLSEVARQAYPNADQNTIRQVVNKNEKNKDIAIYSNEQLKDAQNYIHSVINNSGEKTRDRLTASFRVEDRVLGTPTQMVHQSTTGITLNIDLTSSLKEH